MQKDDRIEALAHWRYTHDEWRNFMRWRKMRKGILQYLVYRLTPTRRMKIPVIVITPDAIKIDNLLVAFSDASRLLRRINVRDAGKLNVLEMTYQRTNQKQPSFTDLFVPVPKGKLREAIEVQEIIARRF